MTELVECSECGTPYDSQEHPFCPRCGSTSQRATVPGALASAQRHDPARRRVQASGAVLLAIGTMFLVAGLAIALVPQERAEASTLDLLSAQPGGFLVIEWPTDAPANLTLRARDGTLLNETLVPAGHYEGNVSRAVVEVFTTQGNRSWNQTVVVIDGDAVTLRLPEDPASASGEPLFTRTFSQTMAVARYVFLGFAVALCAGGLCALLLRLWPLAVVGAIVGILMGVIAMFAFLLLGLLFAIPFIVGGILILRGRRHFRARQPA